MADIQFKTNVQEIRVDLEKLKKNLSIEYALSRIKEVLTDECRRAYRYADEHHDMTFKNRTGHLERAIRMFPIRYLRGGSKSGGKGYRASFGIDDSYKVDDEPTPSQKMKWLTEGTRAHHATNHKYMYWRPTARPTKYAKGNWDKGRRWRVKFVSGIEARGNFLENAMKRTRKLRDAAFDKLFDELFDK